MEQSVCDKACKILQDTRDGEELSPEDLYLVQEMVNDHLNELGKQKFEQLYQSVLSGYVKPFYHGVENMTIDHAGYIYWKGKHIVEHFDLSYRWTEDSKKYAAELAMRCRYLEDINVIPSVHTVVWKWEDYESRKEG